MKKEGKIIGKLLFIIFIVFVLLYFKDDIKSFINTHLSKNVDKNVENNINDSSEEDTDTISEYFAKGMIEKDYEELLSKKDNYIKSNGKYNYVEYSFEKKIHYYEIEEYIKSWSNSSISKVEIIGKSVDERNIYGVEIGSGSKVIFLDANIHAAEVGNTLILTRFLNEMVNNYELGDKDTINMLNSYKIVAIPSINPDGYEVYNYGVESLNNKNLWVYENKDKIDFENIKSNANGVDINRNFPTQNAGLYYKSNDLIKSVSLNKTTSRGVYFGGTSLGSEPETKASMYFMLKHYKNTIYYINMHSQGRVIYAGKPNLTDEFNELCSNFGKSVSKLTGYKLHSLSGEEVGEGNDGSATDFMAELANGLKYSNVTGRLSANKYIDATLSFDYKYPVITLETLNRYTRNPSYFKDEYYNYNINELLLSLIE